MKTKSFKHITALSILAVMFLCACTGKKSGSGAPESKEYASIDTLKKNNWMDSLHICTEMFPPGSPENGVTTKSDTNIYKRDATINDTIINNNIQSLQQPMRAAIWKEYIWTHTDLTVMFLDGDPIVQQKVIATAKQWEKYCAIRFIFGDFANPDITISFKYRGSSSYIGNYSSTIQPSMNLGWLYPNTEQSEYNRVVLHEFGHAIGFIHEHLNPNHNPIHWRTDSVYDYYAAPPNNWDKHTVDVNIFQKYNMSELNTSTFDPKSIMLYSFPASLTTDGYSTKSNDSISELDKKYAHDTYPSHLNSNVAVLPLQTRKVKTGTLMAYTTKRSDQKSTRYK